MGQGRCRPGRHDTPSDLEQFSEAITDFLHQLIEVHVVVGGLRDRGDHLRQHLRAAINGVRRGAVDKGANADTGVHFRTGNFRIGTLSCFGAHEASRH